MTRMLWHSNAPWASTGYGVQTGLFVPHLAEHYDLACSSFYGLEGSPMTWQGVPVLPGAQPDYGNTTLIPHANHWFRGDPRGGLVVTLMDVWVLDPQVVAQVNAACWAPVDHEPAPPAVVKFFMESGAVPIAMSEFGREMLGRLDPLYVPHAVDTSAYRPVEKARGEAFPEGAFVVGMVAANKGRPSRKGFAQAFQAFKRFSDAHDDAFLYLHTMIDARLGQGEDIAGLLNALEIPLERVRFAGQYHMLFDPYSPEDMARIYSSLDVLLNPALGEGFGVPVLEAQACGVPAIVTDFSAMREVCHAGWHVRHRPVWTGQNSWMAEPEVDGIVCALEEAYGLSSSARAALSADAVKHAGRYALPRVLEEHMLPALRVAEQRFELQRPVTISPRLRAAA